MRPRSLSARLARLEAARVAKQQAVAGWGDVGLACLLEGTPPIDSPEALAELRAQYENPSVPDSEKGLLRLLFEYAPPPVECPARPEHDAEGEVDETGAAREAENAAFVASMAAELDSRRAAEPARQEMATIPREPVFPGLEDMPDPGPLKIRNWRR